jgi:adenine-specific DNA methylase
MTTNGEIPETLKLPTTRYQGSKRKLIPWIYENINHLKFESALDVFGGTGSVSYLLKQLGKRVTYNDYLKFNFYKGKAIIENSTVTLTDDDLNRLLEVPIPLRTTFVCDTFNGKYYSDEENLWLDQMIFNITQLGDKYVGSELEYKKCLAYYALFESCLMKRPFNLFHRSNLNLRMNKVERTFGNKVTWETPFPKLFKRFVCEANDLVFSNGKDNSASNRDALSLESNEYDLVYIDPPYFCKQRSNSASDYGIMYHFLEGLANYDVWSSLIDYNSSLLHLKRNGNSWLEKNNVFSNLEGFFKKFSDSIIVLSYKSPGIPNDDDLISLLRKYKSRVRVEKKKYSYALTKTNGRTKENTELLIIGT